MQEKHKLKKPATGAPVQDQKRFQWKNTVKCSLINAGSMVNKIDQLQVFLLEENPDILLITETWLHSNIGNSEISMPGYNIVSRCDRTDTLNGRGGGNIVYLANGLAGTEITSEVSFSQHNIIRTGDLHICLIYRSPNSPKDNNERLNELISKCSENIIYVGDFNFPGINWDSMCSVNSEEDAFLDAVNDKFLHQLVRVPTHTKGNTLDLILCQSKEKIVDIDVQNAAEISDHFVINFWIRTKSETTQKQGLYFNYNRTNFDLMETMLAQINWTRALQGLTTNDAWNTFKQKLEEVVKTTVPQQRRKDIRWPMWMDRNLMRIIRKKRQLWTLYRKTKLETHLADYKLYVKKAKADVKRAKLEFETGLVRDLKSQPKKFYSYVSQKSKFKSPVGPLKGDDGEPVTDDQSQAELLNHYFGSVFTTEKGKCPIPKQMHRGENLLTTCFFSPEHVYKRLLIIKEASSPGPDGISPKILKRFPVLLSYPLAMIFNNSISEGVVPPDWKRANVTAIFKNKGKRSDAGNYRPISLTSIVVRVMEGILKDNITEHLLEHNMITDSQHGFLPSRSTLTNLLDYLNRVTKLIDSGQCVDSIYYDYSKAFDVVPHKRLPLKLEAHGISGHILQWIKCWLSGRTQRVVLNGNVSKWINVTSGVPQGSVLGPVLFLVYTNDMPSVVKGPISMFADDTKQFGCSTTESDRKQIQNDINSLSEWEKEWQMSFNKSKCKVMYFGYTNPRHVYTLNGSSLSQTSIEKDLGINIEDTLKVAEHCSKVASKANAVLGMIKRSFANRDQDLIIQAYKTYVRPHLTYACQAWRPFLKKDVDRLEKVQRRMLRMLPQLRGLTYEEKLKKTKLQSISDHMDELDLVQTYKILNQKDILRTEDFFKKINHNMNTRGQLSGNLVPEKTRLESRKNFFSNRVVKNWNSLPSDVRNAHNVPTFKRRLRLVAERTK